MPWIASSLQLQNNVFKIVHMTYWPMAATPKLYRLQRRNTSFPYWDAFLLDSELNLQLPEFHKGDRLTHLWCVQIMVCSNHMNLQDEVNQVVIHELIHAYDECRAKNLDWCNCAHHACSEVMLLLFFRVRNRFVWSFSKRCCYITWFPLSPIPIHCFPIPWVVFYFRLLSLYMFQIRAGHLSGDCHYKRELLRGYIKLRGHEQVIFFYITSEFISLDVWATVISRNMFSTL